MNLSLIALSFASFRRKRAKNLPLFFALFLVAFIASSILFIASSIKQVNMEQIGRLPDITMQRVVGGRMEGIEERRVFEILEIAGVEWAVGRVWGYYFFPHSSLKNGGANFTILGIDPYLGSEENHKIKYEILSLFGDKPGLMRVGEGVKRAMDLSFSSDSLAFVSPDGELIRLGLGGVLSGDGLYDFILVERDLASEILGLDGDLVSDIIIKVANPKEVATVAKKLSERYPDSKILTKEQILLAYSSLLDYKSGLFLALFITVLLSVWILIYEKASGLSAGERMEISLKRALGWSVGEVMALKFFEHSWLVLISMSFALCTAYIFVYLFDAPFLSAIFISSSDLALPFSARFGVGFFEAVTYVIFGAMLYLSAVMIPVWRGAMTEAGEVIR